MTGTTVSPMLLKQAISKNIRLCAAEQGGQGLEELTIIEPLIVKLIDVDVANKTFEVEDSRRSFSPLADTPEACKRRALEHIKQQNSALNMLTDDLFLVKAAAAEHFFSRNKSRLPKILSSTSCVRASPPLC